MTAAKTVPVKAPAVPWNRVEWRVDGKVDSGGGVRVVCYLDAPTVADLLDDWVGPFDWFDEYEPTGKAGTMWCHLSVRHPESGEWIRKTDLGTASAHEADKGLVSDCFKRVAMRKWGVGRNVFDLPTLRLEPGKFRTYQDKNGNPQAQLTGASQAEIVRMLHALGHAEVAEQSRVNTAEAHEDAPPAGASDAPSAPGSAPPAPTSDHPVTDYHRQQQGGAPDWNQVAEQYGLPKARILTLAREAAIRMGVTPPMSQKALDSMSPELSAAVVAAVGEHAEQAAAS